MPKAIWKSKPCACYQRSPGDIYLVAIGKELVSFALVQGQYTLRRIRQTQYQPLDLWCQMIVIMQADMRQTEGMNMTESSNNEQQPLPSTPDELLGKRWNPKPMMAFQRKGYGTIMVMGKDIIQVDVDWKLQAIHHCITHFQALQQALIMIGASGDIGEIV